MILEDVNFPNFREIFKIIAALTTILPETVNNKACPVYYYTRDLLNYYDANKEVIDKERPNVKKLIEVIKDKIDKQSDD